MAYQAIYVEPHLENFTDEEGVAYVHGQLGSALDAEVQRLLATVNHYPLALAHAVAYIQQGHCSLADYPQHFYLHQLRSHSSVNDPTLETVRTSLLLSLLPLQEQLPQARVTLQSCVGLAAENIPLVLLADIQGIDLAVLQSLVAALLRYGLLSPGSSKETVTLHRVMSYLLDELWSEAAEREVHLKHVTEVLIKRLDYDNRDLDALSLAKGLTIHAQCAINLLPSTLMLEQATLLHRLGYHYEYNTGEYFLARPCFERALVIEERYYGKDHPEVVRTLVNLGNVYGSLGNLSQKKVLLERALVIQEGCYGKNHPTLLATTLMNLGIAYGALGDAFQRKVLIERALIIQERHYGKEHPEVAKTLANLGNAYGDLGDVSRKKVLLERALVIEERYYGKEHPEVAITLAGLGNAYGNLGDASRKKVLLERALVIQERHYGEEHLEVAITLASLGNAYGVLGDAFQQKVLLERALAIQDRHYGEGHPEVAMILLSLSCAELSLNQPEVALKHAQHCLIICQQFFGEAHDNTLLAKNLIQHCLQKLRQPANRMPINHDNNLNKKITALKVRYNIALEDASIQAWEKLFRCAAVEGELEILCHCYKNQEVSINSQDTNPRNLRTALHWACVKQQSAIIKYLLENNAHFDIKDAQGKIAWECLIDTPLLMLFQHASETVLKKYPMVKVSPGSSAQLGKITVNGDDQ